MNNTTLATRQLSFEDIKPKRKTVYEITPKGIEWRYGR